MILLSIFTNLTLVHAQLTPARDLTGVWLGSATWTDSFDYYPSAVSCSFTSNVELDLTQDGSTWSGNIYYTNIQNTQKPHDPACDTVAHTPGPEIGGTVSSSSFSGIVYVGVPIQGTFTTDLISGTITGSNGAQQWNLSFKAERQYAPTVPPSTPLPPATTTPTPAPTPVPQPETITGFVKTDRSIYLTSEEHDTPVQITGQVSGGRGDAVVLTITKPDGTSEEDQAFLTGTGAFSSTYMLDKESPLGNYTLDASYAGTVFGSTSFKVLSLPSIPFSFQIITATFWNVTQGDSAAIPVTVKLVSGEPEDVMLSSTNWLQAGISTDFANETLLPTSSTTFNVKTLCSTSPGNYLFTISGETEGSIDELPVTSEQSVTVTVTPNPTCTEPQPQQIIQPTPNAPPATTSQPGSTPPSIPSWVKNNAKWWSQGQVSDADFIKGIQYLVQQGLITVPPTQVSANSNEQLPSWLKGTAKWWALGQVTDADFVKSIQYLVQNGIIVVPTGTTAVNTAPATGTTTTTTAPTTTPTVANSIKLNPGQTYNEQLWYSGSNSMGSGVTVHMWVDATGSAASWVTPQHLDFGTLHSGQKQTMNYTITVPPGQQLGNYDLLWKNGCTFSDGSTCVPNDIDIPVIVTAPVQYNTFHNHGISFSYPSDWTIQDLTQNSTPNIKIVSGDSSITFTMSELSTSNRFGGVAGQAYLNQLVLSVEDFCNSNSFCSDFNLTNSKAFSASNEQAYVVTFNFIFTEKNGTEINYSMGDVDFPTSSGTWLVTVEGPSTNYVSHSQEIASIVSSIAFDQTTSASNQEYQSYKNSQYGFSIEYPKGWNLVENFGPAYTIQTIMISPDVNLEFYAGVLKNSNPYAGLTSQEILGDVTGMLRSGCTSSTFQSRGFTCTNPQFNTTITSYNGLPIYGVTMFWTKTYSNGTSISWDSLWAVMPSSNDVWLLIVESASNEFQKYSQEIVHMSNSFNVNNVGTAAPSGSQ